MRIGACRKAKAVSPKANPPSGNPEAATPKRCVPKSGSREPEGQPAQRQSPKRCVPKSGSGEPEGQLAQRQSPKRKVEERTRPAATPNRRMPKSGSGEPEGQTAQRKNELAQRPLRIGACRKVEAVNPKANPPSGSPNRSGNPERRKPPKTSVRHPQVEAAKRGVGGAVPTHLPIQSKNAIVTPRGPPRHHKKCFIIRNQVLPRVGKKQKKSRKSLSQLGNKSRKAPNSATEDRKTSKSCEFSPSPPLVWSPGGRVWSDCNGYAKAVSPHAGARESNSSPPVRRFGTKRRFRLFVSAKMPTFAAAIPPQSVARQGSPGVFAAAEALFTSFLKH